MRGISTYDTLFFSYASLQSLFAVRGYMFARCGYLSAPCGYKNARHEQRIIQASNKFTVYSKRFYSMDSRGFLYAYIVLPYIA